MKCLFWTCRPAVSWLTRAPSCLTDGAAPSCSQTLLSPLPLDGMGLCCALRGPCCPCFRLEFTRSSLISPSTKVLRLEWGTHICVNVGTCMHLIRASAFAPLHLLHGLLIGTRHCLGNSLDGLHSRALPHSKGKLVAQLPAPKFILQQRNVPNLKLSWDRRKHSLPAFILPRSLQARAQ